MIDDYLECPSLKNLQKISEGKKFDTGKTRLDLLPARAIESVGEVLTFGATKYGDWNWAKGIVFSRLIGAALRHIFKWLRREDIDSESGLPHLSHAATNLLMIVELSSRKDLDDRYLPPT